MKRGPYLRWRVTPEYRTLELMNVILPLTETSVQITYGKGESLDLDSCWGIGQEVRSISDLSEGGCAFLRKCTIIIEIVLA